MQGNSALFPVAGPDQQNTAFVRFARGFDSQSTSARLVQYLQIHQGHARFLVATLNANTAAPIILTTDQPVMTLGGFSGADEILTTQQLINLVNKGMVRFFLLPSNLLSGFGILNDQDMRGFGQFDGNQNAHLAFWVSTHCRPIPRNQWQSGPSGLSGVPGAGFRRGFGERLFDCANYH
jgi:4-amino-4-deoxy-L-arabinose transferase-like glycosyltransferase